MAERLTIIDFVEKYVSKYSSSPFLWEKNLDTNVWEPTTYEETLKKAKRIAAGLMALGVQKGEKVSYIFCKGFRGHHIAGRPIIHVRQK